MKLYPSLRWQRSSENVTHGTTRVENWLTSTTNECSESDGILCTFFLFKYHHFIGDALGCSRGT